MFWHFIFESLAYAVAFRIYLWQRRKQGDFLETETRWWIVAAAIGGAVVGSKVLYWLEDPFKTLHSGIAYILGGKTMVGALLGGTIAVEWIKRRNGITRRTGDLFAVPMAIGIAIGRIGCLLAGLGDDTYGLPTSLPWGIDLGDGVRRHPVQLYEGAAMLITAAWLSTVTQPKYAEGDRYRLFVIIYCAWRLFEDFLKPGVSFLGLTALQWAALAALIWYSRDLIRIIRSVD